MSDQTPSGFGGGGGFKYPIPKGLGDLNYLQSLLKSVLSQDLNPDSAPTFLSLTLTNLTGSLLVGTNASKALQSISVGGSLSLSGTTLNTIQNIRTTDSPTFAGLTLTTGAGASKVWTSDANGLGSWATAALAAHALDGALHTVSGLTPGHFLKATGATTFGFAAHGLTYSDVGAEASGAVATHAALITGVHGLVFTAGKALTLQKSMTLTAADDTGVYTFPTGTKTILAADGSPAALVIASQATGDLLYASSVTAWARLGIGAAGQALVVNAGGTLPVWGTVLTNPMDDAGQLIYGGAAGAPTKLPAGATTTILVGGGAAAPVWTTATGTGAPMRGTSPTITTSLIMSDGATIGQAAGPLVTFDDTNNYLEITGCNVGLNNTSALTLLDIKGADVTYGGQLRIQSSDLAHITFYSSAAATLSAANLLGQIYYDVANKDMVVENYNGGSFGTIRFNPYGGKVFIGATTSPSYARLFIHDVAGSDSNLVIGYGSVYGTGYSGMGIQSINDALNATKMLIFSGSSIVCLGQVGIGVVPTANSPLRVAGIPVYANNVAALEGGLVAGEFYKTSATGTPYFTIVNAT